MGWLTKIKWLASEPTDLNESRLTNDRVVTVSCDKLNTSQKRFVQKEVVPQLGADR